MGLPSGAELSHKDLVLKVPPPPPPPPPAAPEGDAAAAPHPFVPAVPGQLAYMDDSEGSDKNSPASSTEPSVVSTRN